MKNSKMTNIFKSVSTLRINHFLVVLTSSILILVPAARSTSVHLYGAYYSNFGSDDVIFYEGKCFSSLAGPKCISGAEFIDYSIVRHKGRYFCHLDLLLPNGRKAKQLGPYGQSGTPVYKCTAKGWVLGKW